MKVKNNSAQFVATNEEPKKLVIPELYLKIEKDIEYHSIVCNVCEKLIAPSHINPNIFWGFRCMDTGMFVGNDCKDQYYQNKNAGQYGNEHANKYSEIPFPVPYKNIEKQKAMILESNLNKPEKNRPAEPKNEATKYQSNYSCDCHPFETWDDVEKANKQKFDIGDTVKNRCKGTIGKVCRYADDKEKNKTSFVIVKYGKNASDEHLEHASQIELVTTKSEASNKIVAKKKESKPKTDKKQFDQRTEIVKMRCSHSTRLLLSEMAMLMDCSIADVLHYAIQNLPRSQYKLIKIEQSKLDQVI